MIISIPALLVFSSIALNFQNIFEIGVFNVEDDYSNSYSDGTAGINLHLRLNHGLDNSYNYYLFPFIEPISTGDVVNYGLLSITFYCLNDNEQVILKSIQFDTPLSSSYSMDRIFLSSIFKDSNLTCYGIIELSLETGGIPINDTVNFQLTYIFPVGIAYYYDLDLALYLLFFFQFFLYVIIPVTLNWIFKPIFGLKSSEDDIKRDEKFLNYIQDQASEKKEESKTK